MSRALFDVPSDAASYTAALEGLATLNQRILSRRSYPDVYDAGVVYKRERRDLWKSIPEVVRDGWGDCEDLSAWRVATLRTTGEDPGARVFVYRSGPRQLHAVVQRGDGSYEDPSRQLGMSRNSPMGVELAGDPNMGNRQYAFDPQDNQVDNYIDVAPNRFDRAAFDVGDDVGAVVDTEYSFDPQDNQREQYRDRSPNVFERSAYDVGEDGSDGLQGDEDLDPSETNDADPAEMPESAQPIDESAIDNAPPVAAQVARMSPRKRRQVRRRVARAVARAARRARRWRLTHDGAFMSVGADPTPSDEITFDLYKSGRGWSAVLRLPTRFSGHGGTATFLHSSPSPSKSQAAAKATNLAKRALDSDVLRAAMPPQAQLALKALNNPIVSHTTRAVLRKIF